MEGPYLGLERCVLVMDLEAGLVYARWRASVVRLV